MSFNYSIVLIGCSCLHVAVQHSQMGVVAYLISKGMVCILLVKYCTALTVFFLWGGGGQMGQSNKDTVYVLLWGIEHNRNCEDVLTIFLCVSGTI